MLYIKAQVQFLRVLNPAFKDGMMEAPGYSGCEEGRDVGKKGRRGPGIIEGEGGRRQGEYRERVRGERGRKCLETIILCCVSVGCVQCRSHKYDC